MTSFTFDKEQRCHKRFEIYRSNSFIYFPSVEIQGLILDICKGGVSFCCEYHHQLPVNHSEEGYLFGSNGFCVTNIPVTTLKVFHANEYLYCNELEGYRISAKFLLNSKEQVYQLEKFICHNSK